MGNLINFNYDNEAIQQENYLIYLAWLNKISRARQSAIVITDGEKSYFQKQNLVNLYTGKSYKTSIRRTNSIYFNNSNEPFKIIEYRNKENIIIQYLNTGYITKTTDASIRYGQLKDPYSRSVYQVGYSGVGKYSSKTHLHIYSLWHAMISRCYDLIPLMQYNSSYLYIEVDPLFHNLQIFAKWAEENYYEVPGQQMNLDKDVLCNILGYKNAIYSPTTCIFLPKSINTCLTSAPSKNSDLPVGVIYEGRSKPYTAYLMGKRIGYFDDPEEAHQAYIEDKTDHIRSLAEQYKPYLPPHIYQALLQYKVF